MLVEQLTPAAVAELARPLGRADDVREHHGREDPVRLGDRAVSGEELLDVVADLVGISHPGPVVIAVEVDEPRVGDVLRHVAATAGRDHVAVAVHHQGRHADHREDLAQIELEVGEHQGLGAARAHRPALVAPPPGLLVGADQAGREQDQHRPLAPALDRLPERPPGLVNVLKAQDAPGIVRWIGSQPREASVEDRLAHAVGMGRREERGQARALRAAEDRGALDAVGIHHGTRVVDSLLDRRRLAHWV
jgi:hypothetical protein